MTWDGKRIVMKERHRSSLNFALWGLAQPTFWSRWLSFIMPDICSWQLLRPSKPLRLLFFFCLCYFSSLQVKWLARKVACKMATEVSRSLLVWKEVQRTWSYHPYSAGLLTTTSYPSLSGSTWTSRYLTSWKETSRWYSSASHQQRTLPGNRGTRVCALTASCNMRQQISAFIRNLHFWMIEIKGRHSHSLYASKCSFAVSR